jgi:hypothetical protein
MGRKAGWLPTEIPKVGIWISVGDAALLRMLVKTKTEEVERHLRVNGDGLSEDALNSMKLLSAQLRRCLDAIEKKIS